MARIKSRHAPPRAATLIESLRGLGYSTATALADIVDNSIAAGAEIVDVRFVWGGAASNISILDDGEGMDDAMLERAMRLAEQNPLDRRSESDLGRFGLGMKTASFSQCRRLTVASKRAGKLSCLRWDLDVLSASDNDGWYLLEGPAKGSAALLKPVKSRRAGCLVLWENLDKIVTPGFREQDFLDLIDAVELHLGMVFHRFLASQPQRLVININGRAVRPWNPFAAGQASAWSSPVERISTPRGMVEVQCHVLPHKDRLTNKEHDVAGGVNGWTAQQGFYVYRNKRLLVAGSWLDLGRGRRWTKDEAHRLARIRLDFPSSADADWKIDIRKSTSRPPVAIRERLISLAEDTRARARRVFAHRGQPALSRLGGSITPAWRAEHFNGGVRYRIDRDHPAVRDLVETSAEHASQVVALLRVLEETIPVQRIWLDTAESKETPRTGFAGAPAAEVASVLLVLYNNMTKRKGIPPEEARDRLLRTEPFNHHPALVAALPEVTVGEDEDK